MPFYSRNSKTSFPLLHSKEKESKKKTSLSSLSFSWTLGSLLTFLAYYSIPLMSLASSEMAQDASSSSTLGGTALFAISSGFAISFAAFGGALGQGKLGASAMEGIARNPQAQKDMFVPLMIGMAFIESLVIYAFVIAFLIQNKI